jgi:membrane associated rhomboid family serine protease
MQSNLQDFFIYFCGMTDFRPGGFQQIPNVVKNIIIINVLVYLIQYGLGTRGINLDDLMALHYWQSPLFRWWQLFTHLFMHGSLSHIFFNMFALWMFGRVLENVWGPKRFLIFYIICGLGAAICHLSVLTIEFTRFHNSFLYYQQHQTFVEYAQFIRHHNLADHPAFNNVLSFWSGNNDCSNCADTSVRLINEYYRQMINEATVGASGAVMGVLFGYGYLFPNTMLYLYFAIPVKAKWFVAGYAVIELFMGIQNSAGDNIAHFAHLGGMLFAFILLRIWNSKIRNDFY